MIPDDPQLVTDFLCDTSPPRFSIFSVFHFRAKQETFPPLPFFPMSRLYVKYTQRGNPMGLPMAGVSYRGLPQRSLIYKDLSQLSLPYIALYRSLPPVPPPVASSFAYLRSPVLMRISKPLRCRPSFRRFIYFPFSLCFAAVLFDIANECYGCLERDKNFNRPKLLYRGVQEI